MAKKKMTFDTAQGIVSEVFLTEVSSINDKDAIKSRIVDAQRSLRNIIDAENDDGQLAAARELAKDLGAAYKESAKNEYAKIVVCLKRLEDLGDA